MHCLLAIGGSEVLLILLFVLLFFGSNKIPEVAKMLGKGLREFRKATEEIKKEFKEETKDFKDDFKDLTKDLP
jgi:sec-independent protein translocase protein TatA